MNDMILKKPELQERWKKNLRMFAVCIIAALSWGVIAHSFAYYSGSFSHDSLNALISNSTEDMWKMQIGRVFAPGIRKILRGDVAIPLLIGVYSMVFIGISVYFIIKIFNIESKIIIITICGICTTNLTVSANTATYINDLDYNMLALALSTCAALMWQTYKKGWILGVPLVTIALGIYQSYICVTISIVLIESVYALLNNKAAKDVMLNGLRAVIMIVIACVLYYAVLKISGIIFGFSASLGASSGAVDLSEMSIASIARGIIYAYGKWFSVFANSKSAFCVYHTIQVGESIRFNFSWFMILLHTIMALLTLISIVNISKENKLEWRKIVIILAILLLLPLGSNAIFIITSGISHQLMYYADYITYILVLIIAGNRSNSAHGARINVVCVMIIIGVILIGNVQTSNAIYLKKHLQEDSFKSFITRIVARLETDPDYRAGETKIAFVGLTDQIVDVDGFENYNDILGMDISPVPQPISTPQYNAYKAYFEYVLANPAVFCDDNTWVNLQKDEKVGNMAAYPENGCMKMIGDVYVIKLS